MSLSPYVSSKIRCCNPSNPFSFGSTSTLSQVAYFGESMLYGHYRKFSSGQPSTNCPGANIILLITWSVSTMHASSPLNEKLLTNCASKTYQFIVCIYSSSCMYQSRGTVPRVYMNICTHSSLGTPYLLQPFMQAFMCLSGLEFPLYFILSCGWSSLWPNLSLIDFFMASQSHSVLQCVLHHLVDVTRSAISRNGIF